MRFVAEKGENNSGVFLKVDLAGVLPGRGAYCHPEVSCLSSKRLTESLARSFKGKVEFPKGFVVPLNLKELFDELNKATTSRTTRLGIELTKKKNKKILL